MSFGRIMNKIKSSGFFTLRYVSVVLLCAIILVCLMAVALSRHAYTVVYGSKEVPITTYSTDNKTIAEDAGFEIPDDATFERSETENGTKIIVNVPMSVTVRYGGCTSVISLEKTCTVEAVLDQLKIDFGQDDSLNCQMSDAVYDGMEIEVTTHTVSYTSVNVSISYSTVYRENSSLAEGVQQVVSEGSNGEKSVKYKCVVVNNVIEEFSLYSETVLTEPTDEIIEYGTKQTTSTSDSETGTSSASSSSSSPSSSSSSSASSPSSDSSSGSSSSSDSGGSTGTGISYSEVMTMTATAYTSSNTSETTASGAAAQVGIIAADLSVLPMGTRVYITSTDGSWTYGYAVVGDTGVTGNKVDLYFNTYDECIDFGRQSVLVYILN